MRKIIVTTNISLDGVMQAPMGIEEDRSGNFKYGGWTATNADALSGKAVQKEMNENVDYLLGRKTFDIFASFWPANEKMWPGINNSTKYVLSKTIQNSDPAAKRWKNTVFLGGVEDIRKVKNSEGPDIQVWGSSEIIHLLLEHGLVDELHLRIFPILLGRGKNFFHHETIATAFTLAENFVTSKGVFIATYKRAGEMFAGNPTADLIETYLKS